MIQSQNGKILSGSSGLLDWELTHDPEQHVVLLKTSGPVDKTSFPGMLVATVEVAERHECLRILADHRNSGLELDPLQIYYAPKVIMGSGFHSDFAIALVFSRVTEDIQFMENVCRNSGIKLAVFTDMASAFRWLNDPAKSLVAAVQSEP